MRTTPARSPPRPGRSSSTPHYRQDCIVFVMQISSLRTYIQILQASPGLDRPQDPRPGRRGPVDLADHRRLRPAPPGPGAGRGPAPALGTPRTGRAADAGPGPPRVPEHPRDHPQPGRCAETRQTRAGQAAGVEEPPPGHPPRRGKNHEEGTHAQSTTRTRRLNDKLRRRFTTLPRKGQNLSRPVQGDGGEPAGGRFAKWSWTLGPPGVQLKVADSVCHPPAVWDQRFATT